MTATQRAVVDDLGNINVHGRSALELVWKVKDADGNLVNISASDLFFEIDTKLRIELTAGEDNYSRKLTLSRAQIATLPLNQPLQYALHDETPSSPATIWNGRVTAYGFRTAPSGAAAVDPGVANWTGATVIVQQGESVPTVVVTYMGATGYGMPSGGTVGQYIRKSSSTPYDVAWDTVTGSDVGLGNVDNTSDANKPVSTAQQAALDLKLNLAGGTLSGVLAFIAGTAALPGLAVAGDLNTGIYGVSADVLGVSAGGVQVQSWGVGTSTLTGLFRPDADNTRDLATAAARWRSGYFGTNVVIGYSTTSTAQLHVGGGAVVSAQTGASQITNPQVINSQTSGSASIVVAVSDGANNPRAALFVNPTESLWGLSSRYSSTALPFVIYNAGSEQLRLTTGGLLGLGIVPTSFLHVAGATGATLNTTYEPTGWLGLKHRVGVQYSGDTLVSSINVRLTSLSAGTLDDATNPGAALVLKADGALTLVDTTAGAGVRTFVPVFGVSGAGVATLYNNLLFGTDNSFDVGALAANRARTIYAGTSVVIGASSTPSGVSTANPRVFGVGNNWTLIGASNVTDATNKFSNIAVAHYTNTEEPVIALQAYSLVSSNSLDIGGGTGIGNAMTAINFWTGATNTTVTGTHRFQITSSGHFNPMVDGASDFGTAGQQFRDLYLSRYLRIGGAAPAGAAGLATIQSFGNSWALIGASVLTDATTKGIQIGSAHYTNTEKPLAMIGGTSTAASGIVAIGGGTSSGHAATQISLYTAANSITPTGTERWRADGSGHFFPIADATYNIGYASNRVATVFGVTGDFTGRVHAYSGTAIPAGGTAGSGLRLSSVSNFGVFFGQGAPTLSAAKGSLYLRSDGSGTGDRMYVNTDGATAWTAVTTAT